MAPPKSARPIFTYRTRLVLTPAQDAALGAWAELMGRAERRLFALREAEARGRPVPTEVGPDGKVRPIPLKRRIMEKVALTGRQFNAVERQLEARVASIEERRKGLIEDSGQRRARAAKLEAKLTRERPGSNTLHHKRRRLATLEARHAGLIADAAADPVRLCFGSKRLFRAQVALQENGYTFLDEGRAAWRAARSDQIAILGSGDEAGGPQTCQARGGGDGVLTLTLKLPPQVAEAVLAASPEVLDRLGRLPVSGVRFAYGQEQLEWALRQSRRVQKPSSRSDKVRGGYEGGAISCRLLRDETGWRLVASLEVARPEVVTARERGALGGDLNADHLALAWLDRSGNPQAFGRVALPLGGLSTTQARVVIERLDVQTRKAELEAASPERARGLSALAYGKLQAACVRAGVEVIEGNPAFTSPIGAVRYAVSRGLSVHQGAAVAIARRGWGLSERPAGREARVRLRRGVHVTLALPARPRARHVWTQWSGARRALKAAHHAQARSETAAARSAPGSPVRRGRRAIHAATVGSRGASPQPRSGGDVDFIPQLAE